MFWLHDNKTFSHARTTGGFPRRGRRRASDQHVGGGKDEAEGTCEDTCAAAAEAAAAAAAAAEAERLKGLAPSAAEYVEQYKNDIADAEARRDDAQRLLDETDEDGPREKVASYETERGVAGRRHPQRRTSTRPRSARPL